VGVWARAWQAVARASASLRRRNVRREPANAAHAGVLALANFGGFIVGLAVGAGARCAAAAVPCVVGQFTNL